jgi:recombination protein U
MREFERQNGVAFLLIYYKKYDVYYYLTFDSLYEFWKRAENGGRKSFRYDELDCEFQIKVHGGCIHYLEAINKDLERRESL